MGGGAFNSLGVFFAEKFGIPPKEVRKSGGGGGGEPFLGSAPVGKDNFALVSVGGALDAKHACSGGLLLAGLQWQPAQTMETRGTPGELGTHP